MDEMSDDTMLCPHCEEYRIPCDGAYAILRDLEAENDRLLWHVSMRDEIFKQMIKLGKTAFDKLDPSALDKWQELVSEWKKIATRSIG